MAQSFEIGRFNRPPLLDRKFGEGQAQFSPSLQIAARLLGANSRIGNQGQQFAADFSSRRRELAAAVGADVIVNPSEQSPYQSWREVAVWSDPSRAPQLPPWTSGPPLRPAVIFECVGVPGVIDQIMMAAPQGARLVVVGVCMERDTIQPLFGINKELNVQFVLGYSREEFGAMLRHIAEGTIPTEPLITGKVGVEGVAQAFEDLGSPEHHAKILVEPWRS